LERPSWQDDVVSHYVEKYVPKGFYDIINFHPQGRGIPDIAAMASDMPIVTFGKLQRLNGTSYSSPMIGAMIAMLDDYETLKGRPPLGFLNPWLYSQASKGIVEDIRSGPDNFYSPSCSNNKTCLDEKLGYPTTPGWDAVTGLGVPNFGKMMENLDEMGKWLPA
jgi:tripeptidyl-peptidase-1